MLGETFGTRLNSFGPAAAEALPDSQNSPTILDKARIAAKVEGLTDVDLNFPDHVTEAPAELGRQLSDLGLTVNGLAMRYYTNPAFKRGAFTNPDPAVRREAIDLTKRGIDAAREVGTNLMTIWLGQDGFDYSFQADYQKLWEDEVSAIREAAAHDPDCMISIEYKPNEPRAFSLMPDLATTLLALSEAGNANLGVTLDFAHVLYADEMPAMVAAMIARHSKLLGVHLNDGYAKRDDGLMVASVHPQATLELFWQLRKDGYEGMIYFDTFPEASGLDPIAECEQNIRTVRRLLQVSAQLEGDNRLRDAVARQEAVETQRIVNQALTGG